MTEYGEHAGGRSERETAAQYRQQQEQHFAREHVAEQAQDSDIGRARCSMRFSMRLNGNMYLPKGCVSSSVAKPPHP